MGERQEGYNSQWNEASFKSQRLHEIQENINFYKANPLGRTDNKFNYEWLVMYIIILLGEGRSKYSQTEKKSIDELMEVVKNYLRFTPPHSPFTKREWGKDKKSFLFNQKNFDEFMDLLFEFEMKVKDLNDKHGLTTKNDDDDEGL